MSESGQVTQNDTTIAAADAATTTTTIAAAATAATAATIAVAATATTTAVVGVAGGPRCGWTAYAQHHVRLCVTGVHLRVR